MLAEERGRASRVLRFRWALNSRGGIERYLTETSRELAKRGYTTTIASTNVPPNLQVSDGVRLARTPRHLTPVGAVSPRLSMAVLRARPNIVEVHGLNSRMALTQLAGPWGRVLFPYFHPEIIESDRAALIAERVRVAHRWADAFVLMTEPERDALERLTGESFHDAVVVSPGADFQLAPSAGVDRHYILAVCRLAREKRIDVIIAAAAQSGLLDRLRVIGEGDDRPRLSNLIKSYGVPPETVLRGHVSDEELRAIYDRSHVLVSMSVSESYGITLAEAAAAGLPLIVSDIPPHRSIVTALPERHYCIVPPDDIATLAEQMRDPPVAPPEGLLIRPWTAVADDLDALYQRLHGDRRSRSRLPGPPRASR